MDWLVEKYGKVRLNKGNLRMEYTYTFCNLDFILDHDDCLNRYGVMIHPYSPDFVSVYLYSKFYELKASCSTFNAQNTSALFQSFWEYIITSEFQVTCIHTCISPEHQFFHASMKEKIYKAKRDVD
jgi:hypothetical protein